VDAIGSDVGISPLRAQLALHLVKRLEACDAFSSCVFVAFSLLAPGMEDAYVPSLGGTIFLWVPRPGYVLL
jgi:hypothetical protein